MEFTVEPMRARDLGEVLALWRSTEGIGLDDDIDSPPRLAEYLKRNRGMSFVARSVDGVIVGAVLCGYDGRRGYLHHLAAEKNWRNQGIGSRLVAACLRNLKKAGIPKCNIFVFGHNKAGQSFWTKNGWKRRGDLLVMQKLTEGRG